MDKLIESNHKSEGRKIPIRIVLAYLFLSCLFPVGHILGISYTLLSIVFILITACFLYFIIQRYLGNIAHNEANFWKHEENKIRSTLESIQDGYYEIDMDGNLSQSNHSLAEILGVSQNELLGHNITEFMNGEDAQKLKQVFHWVSHEGTAVNCVEWQVNYKDSLRKSVEGSVVLIRESENGMPLGYRGIIRDITERKDSEKLLAESRYRYKSLVDYNPDLICSIDLEGIILTINPATEKITGFSSNQLLGINCGHFIGRRKVSKVIHYHLLAKKGTSSSFEISIQHKQGHSVDLQIRLIPIIINNQIDGIYIIGKDITEHKQAEETINHMAYHDALTDLPNRRLFIDKLTDGLLQTERAEHKLAVLFLDLDRFKYINDSLGHSFGDRLLKTVADRLKYCIGRSGTIARMGGDEFTILLSDIIDESSIILIARSIIEEINNPILIDGRECSVTASIGISIYPDDGNDAQTLMMNADTAMYRSKETSRNTYKFFNHHMSEQASKQLSVEQELRKAVERNELVLMYQPQVDLISDQITGVEALVRWQHPSRGLVPPLEFIPLAEETGMIVPIGEWVLRTACRQNVEWQMAGYTPMRVAVNLSAYQFKQSNIVQTVAEILRETGLNPKYLELEITESIAMQNAEQVIQTLEALKLLGIQISIDDFGTGYSSLSYLRNFPIDRLKIDKTFVDNITDSAGDAVIAESIIAMAKSLKLEVIAEGVETKEQYQFLKSSGCHEMQGYFFSKPLPVDRLTSKLSRLSAASGH
ncbi:bifunctional diguanylate cyclase/phosphodiesterase [Paenibacillus psychroresistens]|uniref:Bifunctional diguanylate cyclase/phosphodiesterase n=1 Tax=Paenibacillus psychroresistens TaxID=1778678 RepID=A0A6B8RGL0_9BACL|nr:bifunctional diguanylate cyclase/phosphodiesterase [Paenibacillus psychroresistens]QGQ94662.1 bifunctional diguanylate cyclase/phosphodiesterase [Paenibacillus psychroresistens]